MVLIKICKKNEKLKEKDEKNEYIWWKYLSKLEDFYEVQNFALKSLRWVTISYFYDSIFYMLYYSLCNKNI